MFHYQQQNEILIQFLIRLNSHRFKAHSRLVNTVFGSGWIDVHERFKGPKGP